MLKQKSFLSFVMIILQQLIGYVSLYFVSRYMGPEPLGIISAAMAFSSVFMSFSDLGFGIAHVKKVSEGKDLGKSIGTYATLKIGLVTIVGLICFLVIQYISHRELKLPVPVDYISVIYIMLIVSMIGGYVYIAQYTFAARLEKAKEWSSSIISKVITSSLKVLTAINGLGVVFLAWSSLVGAIASTFVAFWFLRKLPLKKFDKSLFIEYSKYALPAFLIGISSTLGQHLDKVFISIFSNVQQVGYYTGAKGITQVITFINLIFVSLLLPTYSRLYTENNIKGIRSFAQRIERYISFPLVIVGMFVFFFSSPLQQMLLGSNFKPSSYIIKILIINAMLLIYAQPYTAQLMGMNKIRLATWLSLLTISLNIVFYLIFIPAGLLNIKMFGLGAFGAALSLLLSTLIGTIIFRIHAFRLTNSKPNYIVLLHWLIGIIVFATMYFFLKDWKWISNIFILGGLFLLGGGTVLVLLYFTRLFTREDLLFYYDTLNLGKLGKYVKKEMNSNEYEK